ncbi:MAG: hypothetical protein FJ028_03365 [Chloroflexi bacterium]|nr:hypothetical protein [Chloroflexota bacterium]
MVDALRAAHRVTKRGGVVIDIRPDAAHPPRIVAGGRVRGGLRQSGDGDARDARADRAVERAVRLGLFRRSGERGLVWHSTSFADLDELDAYVSDSARYAEYTAGTRRALLPLRRGPISYRRAIRFEVLERL